MEILTKQELFLREEEIISKIKKGAIFIYPTDTIYGIGCNALDEAAVKKVKRIKERNIDHFSVWVPSEEWIKENSKKTQNLDKWLNELPGPYTLIVKLKNKESVSPDVYNKKTNTLGVRLPKHWFQQIVEKLNLPIVTTSANKAGKEFMTSLDNLDSEIQTKIDFMIYEGEKKARPSRIVDLEKEKTIER